MRTLRPVRAAAWTALVIAAIATLSDLGGPSLATPQPSIDGVREWLDVRSADEVVFASLRLAALATAWYLLGATVVAVGAALVRWRPLESIASAAAPRWIRDLVVPVAGASAAAGTLAMAVVPAPVDTWSAALDLRRLPASSPGTATMQRLDDPEPSGTATMRDATGSIDTRPAERLDDTWVIEPGEHLWLVAERTLAEAWGREVADAEVVPYWHDLIELNRSRLADPGNPDLVLPGDVMRLPSIPADPT